MELVRRQPGWPRRFYDLASEATGRAFKWGQHDCCLWAADNLKALTLVDPAVPFFRGRYDTEFGARRRMFEWCGGGPREVMERLARLWGLPLLPCDSLEAADPVFAVVNGRDLLGAIDMSGTAISVVTPEGAGIAPLTSGQIGIRVQ